MDAAASAGDEMMDFAALAEGLKPFILRWMRARIAARVYNSADITIGTGSYTTLTFDTEDFDYGGLHSTVSNTGRLTAPEPGIYVISAGVQWEANDTGYRDLNVRVNGATTIVSRRDDNLGASLTMRQAIATVYYLDTDDYVDVRVYQNSGGDLDVQVFSRASLEFAMVKVA